MQSLKRRDGPLQELLWTRVWACCAVANVTGRLHNELAHTNRRFAHDYLLVLRPRDAGQLPQISEDRSDLCLLQLREWRHLLTSVVEALHQGSLSLLRKLCCLCPAHVYSPFLHAL